MKASIIIPAKNGGEKFKRTLKAVFENSIEGGFEVIIIDSGSSDETLNYAKEYPVRLYEIHPEDFSHGKVRNYGAARAQGEYLVFLSQDAVPASTEWLFRLTSVLDEDNDIAGVYGRQLPDNTNPMEAFFLHSVYSEERKIKTLPPAGIEPSFKEIFFSNVNSAIRKRVWQERSFDENINMSEDQEWAKRAMRAGHKIAYEPEAAVYHSHNYNIRTVFRRNVESGYSLSGIIKENFLSVLSANVSYLAKEITYVAKKAGWKRVPYALIYEFARYCGFATGTMKARIKRSASVHKLVV